MPLSDQVMENVKRVAIPISLGLSLTSIGASYKITQYVVETAKAELVRVNDKQDRFDDELEQLRYSQQSLSFKQKSNSDRIDRIE